MAMSSDNILNFWFHELKPEQWYKADPALDAEIARRFGDIHEMLSQGVPQDWLQSPRDVLAAVIVLDQFSRNIHRGSRRAFADDALALWLTSDAIAKGQPASDSWKSQQFAVIEQAKKPKAQLLLIPAPAVQKLVEAASAGGACFATKP